MPRGPAHGGAGRDVDPAWLPDEPVPTPDWMSAEDWGAWCDATAAVDDEPPGSGWDDEEADDPDLAPGERVRWSAGFLLRLRPARAQGPPAPREPRQTRQAGEARHLAQVRHATCTSPVCRRTASQCDFEHNVPFEAGGRTCLCNGDPKCQR
jgi:hypothetical protein